jgi:cytochrome b561
MRILPMDAGNKETAVARGSVSDITRGPAADGTRVSPTRTAPSNYDRVMQSTHWATLLLLIATFGAAWLTRNAETREQAQRLIELHRSLGLTVFCVTVFRLSWRRNVRVPVLPPYLPRFQKLAARTTEYLLYLLLLVQPILGFLHSNAHNQPVGFYFLGTIPAVVAPDKALAGQLFAAHELVALLMLGLVGLHAGAALLHHFVLRDNVLNTMLPHAPPKR